MFDWFKTFIVDEDVDSDDDYQGADNIGVTGISASGMNYYEGTDENDIDQYNYNAKQQEIEYEGKTN